MVSYKRPTVEGRDAYFFARQMEKALKGRKFNAEKKEPLNYYGRPHIGMFQDSFIIGIDGTDIDLRYFPHLRYVEFYAMRTGECPVYLQNIGDMVLYAATHCGTIRLEPGDRKEVTEANAEPDPPSLPDGDLYPADIVE